MSRNCHCCNKWVRLCNKLVHPNKQIHESPPFAFMKQMSQCWLIVLLYREACNRLTKRVFTGSLLLSACWDNKGAIGRTHREKNLIGCVLELKSFSISDWFQTGYEGIRLKGLKRSSAARTSPSKPHLTHPRVPNRTAKHRFSPLLHGNRG